MPGVHELDVSLSPAFIKLIQENKNIPFISITGVKFDKCQVKSKIYGTIVFCTSTSFSSTSNLNDDLTSSHIYDHTFITL